MRILGKRRIKERSYRMGCRLSHRYQHSDLNARNDRRHDARQAVAQSGRASMNFQSEESKRWSCVEVSRVLASVA